MAKIIVAIFTALQHGLTALIQLKSFTDPQPNEDRPLYRLQI